MDESKTVSGRACISHMRTKGNITISRRGKKSWSVGRSFTKAALAIFRSRKERIDDITILCFHPSLPNNAVFPQNLSKKLSGNQVERNVKMNKCMQNSCLHIVLHANLVDYGTRVFRKQLYLLCNHERPLL